MTNDSLPGETVEAFMSSDHGRLDALLARADRDPQAIDQAAFAEFRAGLLRHIAMEEKVLLPFARARRGGVPLEIAKKLREDHGLIAKRLVPSPTHAGCAALRDLLATHNALEEGPDALYAVLDALVSEDARATARSELLDKLAAQPAVPVAPHYDGPPHLAHRIPLLGEPPSARPGAGSAGGALFAKGFRPFFLLAGLFAAVMVPLWILTFGGHLPLGARAYLGPTLWHAHEMIFGFATAVIAGFLLTSVGNWTGRETAVGVPLALLCVLWLAGRVGVSLGSAWPRGVPALLDLAFLPALAIVLARPLFASKNRRNFVMLGVLAALWLANGAMHAEALGFGVHPGVGRRAALVAVDVVLFVIALMAGRIFPMFTRNGTGVATIRNVPSLDRAALGALAAMTLADLVVPDHAIAAWLAAIAGGLAIARARHWGTRHSFSVPLLWVLHVGYAWLPIGLLMRAGSALGVLHAGPALATHALTVGVIGLLTLGMMARVSLGHTGRPLAPPRMAVVAFWAVSLAALVRVGGPLLLPERYLDTVTIAGVLWCAGFALFAAAYSRILVSPRIDGKAG